MIKMTGILQNLCGLLFMSKRGLYFADFFDGSGFGHVRRFEAFKDLLDDVELELATQQKFESVSKLINWEEDAGLLTEIINQYEFITIDSFTANTEIVATFENHPKPIFIDDFRRRRHKRGLVIDGTVNADKWRKKTGDISCYGLDYSFVRKEFYMPPSTTIDYKYAFTFGGQDPKNYLQAFYASAPKDSIFLSTSQYPSYGELRNSGGIYWDTNISQFINLISRSDIVISTAGQTLYELHAMKKPFVSIVFAENHKEDGIGFMEQTGMKCIHDTGSMCQTVELTLRELSACTVSYSNDQFDPKNRCKLKQKIMTFIN